MELQSTRVMRVTTENDGHSDVGDMARCLGSATSAAAAAAAAASLSEILLRRQVSALRFPRHPNRPPMSSPNRNLHATDEMDNVIYSSRKSAAANEEGDGGADGYHSTKKNRCRSCWRRWRNRCPSGFPPAGSS
ncbi:hypothetical protein GW17_00004407 [Ensete ventricosum]|nr:hypothetical protein GW17_00004407 [Ensete ventricosum]RZR79458.1 hypothetical protein BHM03_00005187 [Ensete ventricosum]